MSLLPPHTLFSLKQVRMSFTGKDNHTITVFDANKEEDRGWGWDTTSFSSRRLGLSQPATHG